MIAVVRNVFAPERLPPPPPPELRAPAQRGLLRLLLAPEPLPLEPEDPAPRRRGWLRLLFAPERLDP